jgi:1,4-alpha-glucan branching enzyme
LDEAVGVHLWSSELGYWGDPLYRDVRRDAQSGLAYWARSSEGAAPYDPYYAFRRAQEHANHFVALLAQLAAARSAPLLVPLDLQLLGLGWFEGPTWLRAVLMQCSGQRAFRLATPSAALRRARPRGQRALRDGSWTEAGDHTAWQGSGAAMYWRELHSAEERLARLARRAAVPGSTGERLLNQALRELLLAQGSDWPLLLSAGEEVAEATRRWRDHLRRCARLCAMLEQPDLAEHELIELDQLEEQDNPFPNLNYRIFAAE